METYGEIIDDYDPLKENIYKLFADYFNNPVMTKMKDEKKLSMYVCRLYCLLNKECRYIIAFTNETEQSIGTIVNLSNLEWVSLQTRTLPDTFENFHDLKTSHGYQPSLEGPLKTKIKRVKTTKETSTYECEDYPIIVTLLHTDKNTVEVYQQNGTVIHALETFQTVITFS
jgi:hypothetical protein